MELDKLIVPLSIRESAEYVMSRSTHVAIDDSRMQNLVELVRTRYQQGFDDVEDAFGSTGNLEDDINLVYFETAANFCFWSQNPEKRWVFANSSGHSGGWYGLRNAFAKAIADGVPVHDAHFMSTLSVDDATKLFRGEHGRQIPLLEQRVNNIVEAANFLVAHHGGSARQFVAECNHDAATIAREITKALASYRDGAWYKGKWVWILKRAQILPNDLSQLSQKYPDFVIHGKDQLTVFADYRLPQILEHHGALRYSDELMRTITDRQLVTSGSEEEIEIRAATIVACQRLGELCPDMTVADIDVSLWLLSQDARDDASLAPHHMTVGYFY